MEQNNPVVYYNGIYSTNGSCLDKIDTYIYGIFYSTLILCRNMLKKNIKYIVTYNLFSLSPM